MGMLEVVEAWTTCDHNAEWKQWENWRANIREQVEKVPGVRTEQVLPNGVSNVAPQLRIFWDKSKLGCSGNDVLTELLAGEPRVIVHSDETSVTVMPYMMMPGDDRIAGDRLRAVLSNPPRRKPESAPAGGQPVSGKWDVHIEYVRGEAGHTFEL